MQEINYKEEYYNLRRQISELNDDLVGLIDDIDESYGCVCSAPYLIDKFRHDRIFKLIAFDIEDKEEWIDPDLYSEELPRWVIEEDKKKFDILNKLKGDTNEVKKHNISV